MYHDILNPPAYTHEIKSEKRANETQTQNYELAVNTLIAANICYDIGLFDDSCNNSSRAIEKFIKSCPDIMSTTEHKLNSLLDQFSDLTNHFFSLEDKEIIKKNFYKRQYGDNYVQAAENDAFKGLRLACDVKQQIDIYRQTPISDILQFIGKNKPSEPVTDEYIRTNQFDGMRKYSQSFLAKNHKKNTEKNRPSEPKRQNFTVKNFKHFKK